MGAYYIAPGKFLSPASITQEQLFVMEEGGKSDGGFYRIRRGEPGIIGQRSFAGELFVL